MALIRRLQPMRMDRNSLHDEIDAKYAIMEVDGRVLVQINTYGRATRKNPGKESQTIQLDAVGGKRLYQILRQAFHLP